MSGGNSVNPVSAGGGGGGGGGRGRGRGVNVSTRSKVFYQQIRQVADWGYYKGPKASTLYTKCYGG